MKPQKIRKDFPIFQERPKLTYLDNAATSQKPEKVIKTIENFYRKNNSNIGRGLYPTATKTTQKYEEARKTTAEFIGAEKEEIVLVRNTTEAQNLLSTSLELEGDIVLSQMAHHSEQLPWREHQKDKEVKYLKTKNGKISLEDAKNKIDENTSLVAISHISNVFGAENPVETIIELAHQNNAYVILDCAQSAPHKKINVKELNADFITFSGHKMLGPTGTGILYGKKNLLEKLKPYQVGGGMVKSVKKESVKYENAPKKFEAGTPNIAGFIGLKAGIEYLQEIGMQEVYSHTKEISNKIRKELKTIDKVEMVSPKNSTMTSFKIEDIHSHDIAEILGQNNIAVRAGHHCAQPQHEAMNLTGTTRASPYIYNTEEDIKKFVDGIKQVKKKFNV